jgi:hypothetical protein
LRLKKTLHNICTVQSTVFMVASASVVGAWFCDLLDSRLLSSLGLPVGRFDTELLGVLGRQSLPAGELHGVGTDDAADRIPGQEPIKDIEGDVPACRAPRSSAGTRQRATLSKEKGLRQILGWKLICAS